MKMRYHTVQCSKSQCCKSYYVQNQYLKSKTQKQKRGNTKRQLGQFLLQLALKVQKGNKLPIVPI